MCVQDCPASEDKTAEERGGEQIECFVCRKNVDNGVSMHTLTNTTKVYMHHKLDKIVRGEIELLIEEESVLCTRCASLLNYMDRIEVELNMLTKVILDCIYKKYGMGGVAVDKGHENLLPDVEQREQDCAGKYQGIAPVVMNRFFLAFAFDDYFFILREECRLRVRVTVH